MWFRAKTARRAASGRVSRKRRPNSRRGAGETPQHHSRKPVSSSRRGRPGRVVQLDLPELDGRSASSQKSVQRASMPWNAVSKAV